MKRAISALLVVIAMDALKCAAMVYGEQYAVMNFGMTTMLGYFASSWDLHSMVRYPAYQQYVSPSAVHLGKSPNVLANIVSIIPTNN